MFARNGLREMLSMSQSNRFSVSHGIDEEKNKGSKKSIDKKDRKIKNHHKKREKIKEQGFISFNFILFIAHLHGYHYQSISIIIN